MQKTKIYLASSSPRRRQLLDLLGVDYEVKAGSVDESGHDDESPGQRAIRLALAKAKAVREKFGTGNGPPVLAADTLVVIDGAVLGKPSNLEHAIEILNQLSGRTHEVYTAVGLISNSAEDTRLSRSNVTFRRLSQSEIIRYWNTGEPADKAGAYAIQGLGSVFVEKLHGSFSGVMGLPLLETAELLEAAGVAFVLNTGTDRERGNTG